MLFRSEAVPGPSVFPSGEPGVSGDSWGSQEGCQGPFRPSHPGSQASSRGEAKDPALLLSHHRCLLEPTEWPKGSQTPCGVWREDSGLLSRPCRKRRPSSRDDRGVLLVFSSCSASVQFLTRCDGKLREPFMWRQGSQVSMRMARGSASLLSRYCM